MDFDPAPLHNVPLARPEFDGFAVFVVGGAVRDTVRGHPFSDVDLMAVPQSDAARANPIQTLRNRENVRLIATGADVPDDPDMDTVEQPDGSLRVVTESDPDADGDSDGNAMPVFQDGLGREVALPRTEQNAGAGHREFDMALVNPNLSVREQVNRDLQRRDLAVNAMAFNPEFGLVDPFNGQQQLADGVLGPADPDAFAEDPLRVVRAARFLARLNAEPNDTLRRVARDAAPNVAEVPPQRVAVEMRKVGKQAVAPRQFPAFLRDVGALPVVFPPLADLFDRDGAAGMFVDRFERGMNAVPSHDPFRAFFALGFAAGDRDRVDALADHMTVSNREQYSMRDAADREFLRDVANAHQLPAGRLLDVANRLDNPTGLPALGAVPFAVGVTVGAGDGDAARAALRDTFRVMRQVDGRAVMDREGLQPSDVGSAVEPSEFRQLMRDHRVAALSD